MSNPSISMPKSETRESAAAGAHRRLRRILSLDDFERAAHKRLPKAIFGYVAGAAEDNRALVANRRAFDKYELVTRVLRDVSLRTQRTVVLGKTYSSPFGIAPMGLGALSAYRGDFVMASAAEASGIPCILSGSSLTPMEDVIAHAPHTWFQAYLPGSLEKIQALIDRVEQAGFETLVVTVDIPVSANRENNVRAGFSTPLRPTPRLAWDGLTHPRWLLGVFIRTLLAQGMPHFENAYAHRGAPILSRHVLRDFSGREHLNWSHVEAIRKRWRGSLVIKGILSATDAVKARDVGADGVIVSNHGGRQLDRAVAPLRVLPSIDAAVGKSLTVMMDGGIRRGTDVLMALALGARFVFVGRPFNFAAAVAGHAGVSHAIGLLRDEVDRDIAMLGLRNWEELSSEMLMTGR